MRKLIIMIMVGMIITVSSGVCKQKTSERRIPEPIETALFLVESIERKQIDYVTHKFLYGLSGNKDFVYIKLSAGYIIANAYNGALSEYNLYYDNNYYSASDDYSLYAGPYNYLLFSSLPEMEYFISNASEELVEKNYEYINTTSSYSCDELRNLTRSDWVGIPSWKMEKYSSGMWVNNSTNYPSSQGYGSGGICGTIATAGLLAYYQDYVNSNYVPSTMRTQYSSNPGTLITTLFTYIDQPHPSGTVGSHLRDGGNSFLQTYYASCTYEFESITFSPWANITAKISFGYPVVVGTLAILGSDYGNHWVLAYLYYDDTGTANDVLLVVDNHGLYNGVVQRSWVSQCVRINN